MHNCIMGFYFRYQVNTGAFPHKYRSVDLVNGRPLLDERMEFADHYGPFCGELMNLPLRRGMGSPKGLLRNIHQMIATKSDVTFHNSYCLRRFYNNFLPRDFDDYELEHIKYENVWMAHSTRWEEDVCMYIVLTNFNREWWNCGNNGEVPLEILTQEKTRSRWMPYRSDAFVENLLRCARNHALNLISFDDNDENKPLWDDEMEKYYQYVKQLITAVTWMEESLK
mmetsp:Transcript_16893/g.25360  ORF Transcript_16893/g.25360 Transcript_16893/m.25360 type:complete len:225 (+) Transcript_16893:2-676(+)